MSIFIKANFYEVDEKRLADARFDEFPAKTVKFSPADKLSELIQMLSCLRCLFPPNRRPKQFSKYIRGLAKVKHEMSLFRLIQTIQKMKACMAFLIKDDAEALKIIHQTYLLNSSINGKSNPFNNDTLAFLDRDEKRLKPTKMALQEALGPSGVRALNMTSPFDPPTASAVPAQRKRRRRNRRELLRSEVPSHHSIDRIRESGLEQGSNVEMGTGALYAQRDKFTIGKKRPNQAEHNQTYQTEALPSEYQDYHGI